MIIKYKEFLSETINTNWTENDPEYYGITNYKWVSGFLDCYQDVNLAEKNLTKLPFRFGHIQGFFTCSFNQISDLSGSPTKVDGFFSCSVNNLSSLDNCPKMVKRFVVLTNPVWDINTETFKSLDIYPVCIVKDFVGFGNNEDISQKNNTQIISEVTDLIKSNKDLFIPLLDNKIAFHQMIMRLNPDFIKYYHTIQPPSKKSIL